MGSKVVDLFSGEDYTSKTEVEKLKYEILHKLRVGDFETRCGGLHFHILVDNTSYTYSIVELLEIYGLDTVRTIKGIRK